MTTRTIELLKDFYSTGDNVWMQNKLELLELEIEEIYIKGKMDGTDTCINLLK